MYRLRLRLVFFVGVVGVLVAAWAVAQYAASHADSAAPQPATPLPASETATASATTAPSATPSDTPTRLPSPTPTASSTATQPTETASPTPTDTLTPWPTATDTPEPVSFTITISGTYGRDEPDLQAVQRRLLPRGQIYTVSAQSADGIWLQLDVPDVAGANWVPAAFGALQGPRDTLPVAGPPSEPLLKTVPLTEAVTAEIPAFQYLPGVSAHSRDIYRFGLLAGNNPHAFIKVGDCQAITPYFLAAFDNPKSYRLGDKYGYLQETIRQFAGSFAHDSAAANIGFGSTTVLDPTWANPDRCETGESPLVCEFRLMRPTLALISLGTNDTWQTDTRFESDLRRIIEFLTRQGVVPILSTKADNVEGDGRFNKLMLQLAAEYDIPLWDFWSITRDLPNYGITDSYHLSWGPAVFDDPQNMLLGWPWRNLTALQVLDTVWRSVR
jgi:hypothetical protein